MSIARQIKTLMAERGINQIELAEKLEVPQSNISRALSESRDPKISTLLRIADALNCDVVLKPRNK